MGLFDDEQIIEVEVHESKPAWGTNLKRTIALLVTAVGGSIAIFYTVWKVVILGIFSAETSATERILYIVCLVLPTIVGCIHGRRLYHKSYKFGGIWLRVIGSGTLIPTIITSIPFLFFDNDTGMSTGSYILILILLYMCISIVVGLVAAIVISLAKRKRNQ